MKYWFVEQTLDDLQSQHNSIEDDDNVKLLLAYIKKVQNTTGVGTLAIDETAPSTKGVVGRKEVDISVRKVIYTTG